MSYHADEGDPVVDIILEKRPIEAENFTRLYNKCQCYSFYIVWILYLVHRFVFLGIS